MPGAQRRNQTQRAVLVGTGADAVALALSPEQADAILAEIEASARSRPSKKFKPYVVSKRLDNEDPAILLVRLRGWVTWLVKTYDLGVTIRPCWFMHPGAVEALGSAHVSWRGAFEWKDAHPDSGQAWHGRLMNTLVFLEKVVKMSQCEEHPFGHATGDEWRMDEQKWTDVLLRTTKLTLLDDGDPGHEVEGDGVHPGDEDAG